MTPILLTLLLVAWTLLVVRLLSFRATISDGTILGYLALGLLLGPTVVLLLHRLVNPYSMGNFPYTPLLETLLSLGTIVALLLPVLVFLVKRRVFLLLSVADLFLIGFALGMGFDLLGFLTTLIDPWTTTSLLPPWRQQVFGPQGNPVWLVGMAYRTGFVAMACGFALRFLPKGALGRVVVGLVTLCLAVGAVSWSFPVNPDPEAGARLSDAVRGLFSLASWDGAFTAWAILALLVGTQLFEMSRVGAGAGIGEAVREMGDLMRALATWQVAEYRRLRSLYGVRRQAALGAFGLQRAPGDATLARVVPWLQRREQELAAGALPAPAAQSFVDLRLPAPVVVALPWVAILVMVFWPGGLARFFVLMLTAWLFWWFVSSPSRIEDFDDADDLAAFYAGRSVQTGVLLAALLAYFGVVSNTAGALYPLRATWFAPQSQTPRNELDFAVFTLLLAVSAALLNSGARTAWLAQPWSARRRATLRRVAVLASAFAIAWLGARAYGWAIPAMHQRWGDYFVYVASVPADQPRPEDMPGWLQGFAFEQPSPFGNNLPVWLLTLVFVPALIGLARLSRRLLRAIDEQLASAPKGPAAASRAPPAAPDSAGGSG